MRILLVFILATTCLSASRANQEATLPFSVFHIESMGVGSSGKIIIDGRENESGEVVALVVTAFGKEHVLPKDLLARLQDCERMAYGCSTTAVFSVATC